MIEASSGGINHTRTEHMTPFDSMATFSVGARSCFDIETEGAKHKSSCLYKGHDYNIFQPSVVGYILKSLFKLLWWMAIFICRIVVQL